MPISVLSRTVPIVFPVIGDPVGAGFVDSLARPGGNATGFMSYEYSLSGKWLELLKQIAPGVTRVAVLRDAASIVGPVQFGVIQAVAPSLRVEVNPINMRQGLKPDGKLDQETWAKLTANSGEPVLVEYTVTEKDVKGPFAERIPAKMEDKKDLEHLGYRNALEALSEKFHMSEALLKALNPGKTFDQPGEVIVVANVKTSTPNKAAKIEIDKSLKMLRAFGKDGKLIAVYPATIGSSEKPAPSGTLKVTAIAHNPTYRYNPEYKFKGVKSKEPFTIKPGPNNPVGSVRISLSAKGYGIHGTPQPSKVSKTESNGCIRLTNWDALELAAMVDKGIPVAFLEPGTDAMASANEGARRGRLVEPARRR